MKIFVLVSTPSVSDVRYSNKYSDTWYKYRRFNYSWSSWSV